MSTIERRQQITMTRIRDINDAPLLELATEVANLSAKINSRLKQLRLLRWVVRALLVAGTVGAVRLFFEYSSNDSGLSLKIDSWNEAVSLAADSAELTFLFFPILFALFFVERFIERMSLLKILSQLELSTDLIYDQQFDDNTYETKFGVTKRNCTMLDFLDCCTALLLLIRMLAQKAAEGISDRVVLERCGIIRRGAGDNHSRILMKIGIMKSAKDC